MTDQQSTNLAQHDDAANVDRSDRFDSLPKGRRVGAHRINAGKRNAWPLVLIGLVLTVLLSAAGIFALQQINPDVSGIMEGATKKPAPTKVQPVLNPDASVAVLNGSVTSGMQDSVASEIDTQKWGKIAFTGVADKTDVKISAVFYGKKSDEAAALALAKQLGGVSSYQSDSYAEYQAQLVVLLGSDYAGPGAKGTDPAKNDDVSNGVQ